ncbi:MAG: tungsten formylmethanofuran dehydrogenase [FCB group bacterium]|nr:tungsten formylmethanofuran dehydrogenase [FCB group bacterium]
MKFNGYTKTRLLEIYRLMALSRRLDEKQLILLKQGKGFFHIGASGHEAAQLGAAVNLKTGSDYAYPYYRDQALNLGLGVTAYEILLAFLARADDPSSGGRQMPQHFGHKKLRIVSQSSPTGTQYLQAVGAAFACKREGLKQVVYVSSGEGTTSQGDFHEALNWASREKAPVIFHVENNGYAISVPIADQTAGGSVYKIAAGFHSLARHDIDGTDFFSAGAAFKKAVDRARKGQGPSLIVSNVVRLLPHSSSDDQRKYRDAKELEKDKQKDPLVIFADKCVTAGIIRKTEFETVSAEVKKEIDELADRAALQSDPDPAGVEKHLYSGFTPVTELPEPPAGERAVMVDAINHALDEELALNDKMVIYGQDVAGKKGGVFTATRGLSAKYGEDRIFNGPLAESSIIGTAVGMATCGYKPVVEIQFGDYIWTAMMQLRNEVATLRYRSNNAWACPLVIRVPVGGYIHGGLCHSQSIDGYFAHLPGIFLAYPSTAADAKGLLKTACRMEDPVLFMEHKGLYRQGYAAGPEPDENYLLPFGRARLVQEGYDLTVVTWGATVQKSVEAARTIEASVEIIDIRTLNPLDMDTIRRSIKKTSRVLVTHEDNLTGGFGAEIAARIADECFDLLDAPVKRVASLNIPIAYAPVLEREILVQSQWIEQAIRELLQY